MALDSGAVFVFDVLAACGALSLGARRWRAEHGVERRFAGLRPIPPAALTVFLAQRLVEGVVAQPGVFAPEGREFAGKMGAAAMRFFQRLPVGVERVAVSHLMAIRLWVAGGDALPARFAEQAFVDQGFQVERERVARKKRAVVGRGVDRRSLALRAELQAGETEFAREAGEGFAAGAVRRAAPGVFVGDAGEAGVVHREQKAVFAEQLQRFGDGGVGMNWIHVFSGSGEQAN